MLSNQVHTGNNLTINAMQCFYMMMVMMVMMVMVMSIGIPWESAQL